MAKRKSGLPLTDVDRQEFWRCEGARADVPLDASWCHKPAPDLIGPMMPTMLLWFARGRPKSSWEVAADARHAASRAPADLFEWASL
jgi:hypothetical protein